MVSFEFTASAQSVQSRPGHLLRNVCVQLNVADALASGFHLWLRAVPSHVDARNQLTANVTATPADSGGAW
jgi:hypothetical protein